jgi:hypothetical protein
MDHSLRFSMGRGQRYDGASNMKGKANGLKTCGIYFMDVSSTIKSQQE